jgi:predicted HTH domain antitoxin
MRTVEVTLSSEAFEHERWEPSEVAREMRLLWLLEQVRRRHLGFGKAAELAGVPVGAFLDAMAKHHVTPFDYDADELDRELA